MKKSLLLLLIIVFVVACKSDYKEKAEDLADLNLYLQTNEDIDSVLVIDISQQREKYKVAFSDTIRINFKDSINDLYNIWFLKNGEIVSSPVSNQLWLNGKNLVVKGRIDKKLIVDTVIGSKLYNNSKNYNKAYKKLFDNKADSEAYDKLIFSTLKNNYDNPFSLVMAESYILRNQNDESKLKKLDSLITDQNNFLKNHKYFQPHNQLEKMLGVRKLHISSYKFYDRENKLVDLNYNKDKMVLLDLWFVNCPPCIRDHKIISKKLQSLKDKNIELIGVSIDNKQNIWNEYLTKNSYGWSNYRQVDSLKTITKDFAITAFPTYMLIDKNKNIISSFNSFEEVETYLSKK